MYIGKLSEISSNIGNKVLHKITHLSKFWKYDYNDGSDTHIVSIFKLSGAIILNRLYL